MAVRSVVLIPDGLVRELETPGLIAQYDRGRRAGFVAGGVMSARDLSVSMAASVPDLTHFDSFDLSVSSVTSWAMPALLRFSETFLSAPPCVLAATGTTSLPTASLRAGC